MAKAGDDFGATVSVLDRLIDYEPAISREPASSRSRGLKQLKETVRRDLEWLLNTRETSGENSIDSVELSKSLAVYGLPDFTNLGTNDVDDQKKMRWAIQDAIRVFEPRLQDVQVSLQASQSSDRLLHFRIDARLRVDPAPEPISFDTVLQLVSGEYEVKEE
ncbi:MAG TPA: type VI secretion system baseplate subunit TssE [Pyrinomonadaceae bacterium]|nr:type VI secretion system baseplate subunit TssE [Pyrinomonadaceae bacterium]